jgi:hypothetical protein
MASIADRHGFYVIAVRAGMENGTKASQSALNLHHGIDPMSAGASVARSLGSEPEPSNQVARNDPIGAQAGARECAAVDKLSDRLLDLELSSGRAG